MDKALSANTTLSHYRIVSKIGAGGMGEVYLAQDTKLDRKVALKVLSDDFANDSQRMRRFVQEAKTASGLNHPNILTIHEIEQVDAIHFIATEFIDGETLRQRMKNAPPKLGEVLDVAAQIASALSAAHAAGIVHRDIKPENVMLRRDGIVKVLDFGLAKLTERLPPDSVDAEAPTSLNTDPGTVVGTAIYMSPEQARGLQVDARTDIFSLGVLIYEMLAGRLPFEGSNTNEIVASILSDREVTPLARYSREVPAELERIVSKGLRKNRDERYQTIKDMLLDLKSLKQELEFERKLERSLPPKSKSTSEMGEQAEAQTVPQSTARATATEPTSARLMKRSIVITAAALIVIVSVTGAYFYFTRSTRGSIDSVAVLPFVNESKDPNTEYLSEGISDSIINRLSQLSNLRVASFSSTLRYKGQAVDPLAVGRALNVRAVLIGWMTKHGDALSFRTELVDVRDNRRLWGEQYNNHQVADVLQVQEQIARDISDKLRLRLSGADQERLARSETKNSEAYQLYLQGRYYWNKYTQDGFRKSIGYFKQAVDKDPSYALAYSGLADSCSLLGELSVASPKESFPQARAYAEKALVLDETLAEAHLSLGIVKLLYDWDWTGAEKELRRAKELNPNYPDAYHFYGHYLQSVGRVDQAVSETRRGVELDPTSLVINAELGWAHYCARQYDQAIAQGRKTLELDPNFVYASWVIAQSYEQTGRYQESIPALKKARAIDANWPYIVAELGYAYAASGERAEAENILQQLKERAAREYIDAILIAYIYVALDEKEQAFFWLQKAYQERSGLIPWLKVESKFDPLRSDPRFGNLLSRIGLP